MSRAALTERERQVLEHVVLGKMNKGIAAELRIHERTVKLHRTAITTRVRVQSVAELISLVHEAAVLEMASVPRARRRRAS